MSSAPPSSHSPAKPFAIAGECYVGLMSGTSTDGVDAVLAQFPADGQPVILSSASVAIPDTLRHEFLSLNTPGHNELERSAVAGNKLADLYALATHRVLNQAQLHADQITAIGAHGQTVRHAPETGYTIQINAPARLAELTRIDVIADFRSRDVAAGGQGAPLVPAFHHAVFAAKTPRAVLNLGGIANITVLHPDQPVRGFDTGPANVLLDTWVHRQTGQNYDNDGQWAAQGTVNLSLLQYLLDSEPWLRLAPPKSTGRHLFNEHWLIDRLHAYSARQGPVLDVDVQATLQALTAHTVAAALRDYAPHTTEVLVCGGGALNSGLMATLEAAIPCTLSTTAGYGVPVQQVEALAFAWLAHAWTHAIPASLPEVTGAQAAHVLGCKYPA